MTDPYRAIRDIRERLARIEKMATAAQAPPADNPATFGDALDTLRRAGSASGPAIATLRRQITEGPTPTSSPHPARLAEATARLTADLAGNQTIEGAFSDMQRRASRRDAIENAQAGASGRVDALDGPTSRAIDKALQEGH